MAYTTAKQEADDVANRLEAAKTALVAPAAHPTEHGAGVAMTRLWKTGSVDYQRVLGLQGVGLSTYRTKPREEALITVE